MYWINSLRLPLHTCHKHQMKNCKDESGGCGQAIFSQQKTRSTCNIDPLHCTWWLHPLSRVYLGRPIYNTVSDKCIVSIEDANKESDNITQRETL